MRVFGLVNIWSIWQFQAQQHAGIQSDRRDDLWYLREELRAAADRDLVAQAELDCTREETKEAKVHSSF